MTEIEDHPLRRERATNNPYWQALKLLALQLRWDARPQAWVSRRRLLGWRDRFPGQKAVILCNGPSLLKSDLSRLDGVFTFGLNKINLLFDRSSFRPSCIVSVNELVLEQNADFFNSTEIPLFLDSLGMRHVRPRETVVYLNATRHRAFARDCSIAVYQSNTVTFVALQLAFHMGFAEVALIGCDHNFATRGPANLAATSGERDESHFDPNYFAGGVKWHLPDLFESEVGYTMAKNVYEAFGRRVVNATVGGKLEIFPRQTLEGFLSSG
jgi:hypothetical protein